MTFLALSGVRYPFGFEFFEDEVAAPDSDTVKDFVESEYRKLGARDVRCWGVLGPRMGEQYEMRSM